MGCISIASHLRIFIVASFKFCSQKFCVFVNMSARRRMYTAAIEIDCEFICERKCNKTSCPRPTCHVIISTEDDSVRPAHCLQLCLFELVSLFAMSV